MKTSNRILVTASAITISIMSILGCSREKSAEEIYNEKASGVVMRLNEYFYSVTLPTGESFYFSDIQDGKLLNVAFSQNQVKTTYSFGTGFFIDNYGGILTNRHVVNHYIKKSDVIHYVQNLLSALAAYAQERQEKAMYEGGRIYQYLRQSQYDSRYASYDEQLKQRLYELSREYDQAQNYIAQIKSISASQIAVRCHSKVGIAFNDSYVSGPSDFKQCTVEKESEDENVDLALIRLADAVTPQGAAVFSTGVDSHGKIKATSADKLTLDQQLYLIGYRLQPGHCSGLNHRRNQGPAHLRKDIPETGPVQAPLHHTYPPGLQRKPGRKFLRRPCGRKLCSRERHPELQLRYPYPPDKGFPRRQIAWLTT